MRRLIPLVVVALACSPSFAEDLISPGAQGRPRLITGGRDANSIVMKVTTLEDNNDTGYCEPGDAGTFHGGTAGANWEDASTCTSDSECDNTGGGAGQGNCIFAPRGSAARIWQTGSQGYCCTTDPAGDADCPSFRSPADACNIHVTSGDPDDDCATGGDVCVYDYVPRYGIPNLSGMTLVDPTASYNFQSIGPKITWLGHLAPSKDGNPTGYGIRGGEMVFVNTRNVAAMFWQVHAMSFDAAAPSGFIPPHQADGYDAMRFTTSNTGSADGSSTDFFFRNGFFTGGGDETVELKNTINMTIQDSIIAGAPTITKACKCIGSQLGCDCTGGQDCPTDPWNACETDDDCTNVSKGGWADSECLDNIAALGSLTMLVRQDSELDLLGNMLAMTVHRAPKTDSPLLVNIINNFISNLNERDHGGAANELPVQFNNGGKECARANFIGNIVRPGPEYAAQDAVTIHKIGRIASSKACCRIDGTGGECATFMVPNDSCDSESQCPDAICSAGSSVNEFGGCDLDTDCGDGTCDTTTILCRDECNDFTGPQLYMDNNVLDYGGTGTVASTWTGVCKMGTTNQGIMCVDDDDCGGGANDCDPSPCPPSAPCDLISDLFWDQTNPTTEVAKMSTVGITILPAGQTCKVGTEFAGNDCAIDDDCETGSGAADDCEDSPMIAKMLTPASRKLGPWVGGESVQTAWVLDSANKGDEGTPYAFLGIDCNASATSWCPDGTVPVPGTDKWTVGTASSGVSSLLIPDGTPAKLSKVLTTDTYVSGSCASGGGDCNCDQTARIGVSASAGECTSADCAGDCVVNLCTDIDDDGICDPWETTECSAPTTDTPSSGCDPNSTTACNSWEDDDGNNHYSCLEVYSYQYISEMTDMGALPATDNSGLILENGVELN